MAVTEFNILADGTWGPRISADGVRRYGVRLEAITDSEMTGPDVLAYPGMPRKFGAHAHDSQAFCVGVECQQNEDDANYWILDYEYTTNVAEFAQAAATAGGGLSGGGESSPEHNDADPLDRRPVIKLRTKMYKATFFRDYDDVLIANRAGDFYEGTNFEHPRLVIDVTRNIPDFDYTLMNECVGGVNVTDFIGYGPRQVKCEELTADAMWEQGTFYWKVHAQFIVAVGDDLPVDATPEMAWYEWKVNAGYSQLVNGTLRPIFIGGQKPARPQLLNADGTLRTVGLTPIYLGFRLLRDAPLNSLGLFD